MGKSDKSERPAEASPRDSADDTTKVEISRVESASNSRNTLFRVGQTVSLSAGKWDDAQGGIGTITGLMRISPAGVVRANVLLKSVEDGKTYTVSVDLDSLG